MATAGTSCVVWEWQRDDGGFSPYPPETSSQIETAFSSYSGSGSYVMTDYTIHFSTMRQKKDASGEYQLPLYDYNVSSTLIMVHSIATIDCEWNCLGNFAYLSPKLSLAWPDPRGLACHEKFAKMVPPVLIFQNIWTPRNLYFSASVEIYGPPLKFLFPQDSTFRGTFSCPSIKPVGRQMF